MRHIASLLLVLVLTRPALAAEVMVFETSGPNGKQATNTILEALRSNLPNADVTLQNRPRGLRTASIKLAKKISKAVAAGDAAIGVATSIVKKRRKISIVVVVVNAGGAVVFDKVTRLPRKRPDKKIKGLMKNAARAIDDDLRAASASEPEPEPEPEPIAATPIAATPIDSTPDDPDPGSGVGNTIAPPPTPLIASRDDEPVAVVATSRHRRSKEGFHAAVRGGAGGLFFQDEILTTVRGGELDIAVGMTLVTLAGIDLAYDDWLTFTGSFRHYSANIAHDYEGDDADTAVEEPLVNPKEIGCTGMGISALLGTGMQMGPLIGGLVAGVNYDSFSAAPQRLTTSLIEDEVAVLVPSWTRLATAAGITLSYGNLASKGVTGQVGALIIPFAVHQETPRTSGESSSVLGGQGWLRARYSLADLFGSAGGLFAEVRLELEFLKIQFEGNGTRQALGNTVPVQASKESRLMVGGGLTVGYVY